jgi:hypothetical protein
MSLCQCASFHVPKSASLYLDDFSKDDVALFGALLLNTLFILWKIKKKKRLCRQ